MIMWIVVGLLSIMSVIFLCGKGSFLIAGYNTANEQEKAKYDEVKLCQVTGVACLIIALSMLISIRIEDIAPYVIFGGIVIGMIVMFVGNKTYAKKDDYDFIPKKQKEKKKWYKDSKFFSLIFTGVILVVVGLMMFTGGVDIEFNESSFIANASMTSSTTVNYEDIISVEYKENIELGRRTWGVGSAKIVAGNFKNSEFDSYKLYAYTRCKEYVVVSTNNGYVVVNDRDEEKTLALYKKIQEIIKKEG